MLHRMKTPSVYMSGTQTAIPSPFVGRYGSVSCRLADILNQEAVKLSVEYKTSATMVSIRKLLEILGKFCGNFRETFRTFSTKKIKNRGVVMHDTSVFCVLAFQRLYNSFKTNL